MSFCSFLSNFALWHSDATNGRGPRGPIQGPSPWKCQTWPIIYTMQCHTRTVFVHLYTWNGLKQAQKNCPACYSLSQDKKAIYCNCEERWNFTSKCTRNCLAAGLHPKSRTRWRSLQHSFRPLAGFNGQGSREGRSNGKVRKEGERGEVGPHLKQKSVCATALTDRLTNWSIICMVQIIILHVFYCVVCVCALKRGYKQSQLK